MISYITSKFSGWITTLCDTINTTIFGGSPTTSPMVKSDKISSQMTSLFTNTKVNVIVYASKIPMSFTFPGAPVLTKHSILLRLKNLSFYLPALGQTIFMMLEMMIMNETIRSAILYKNPKVSIDSRTGKIRCSLNEVTCYVSSSLIDLLREDDDEVLAALLHEVGHNMQVSYYLLSKLLSAGSLLSVSVLFLFAAASGGGGDDAMAVFLVSMLLLIGTSYLLLSYMSRRQEIVADEFVIKCGYGNAISRAIKKLHRYIYDSSIKTTAINNLNFIDRIGHFFGKIAMFIYNQFSKLRLTGYPDMRRREDLIDTKNNERELLGNLY